MAVSGVQSSSLTCWLRKLKYLSCSDIFEDSLCEDLERVQAGDRQRVREYKNAFPGEVGREVLETVSNDTGVCARTVANHKAQCLSGKVASPKRRPRNVEVLSTGTVKHAEFTRNAIRLKVHRKYPKRGIPTLLGRNPPIVD
ncbi:hypothetical protein HPB47_007622 [Ixodes persulcatus]|uniref:Uncharacterized protein n=1 Tax=Ixodes persulcatus TaxID=34615 RepID=A0AC60P710_IXOPE|nr:hypothetical protein HPB47_007622 [Ixodes persulcatus]